MLVHRYSIDGEGLVTAADIVPPTSQNQLAMEADVAGQGATLSELPLAEACAFAERLVRNHDPCISCSTHFLKARIERT